MSGAWGGNPLKYDGAYDLSADCSVECCQIVEYGVKSPVRTLWAIHGSWCPEERCGFDNDYCCVNNVWVRCESEEDGLEKLYQMQVGARRLYDR